MDDWKRTKAKERIRAWKKTLSKEDLQEYKRRNRLRKEAVKALKEAVEIVNDALTSQDKDSIEKKSNHLTDVYFFNYEKRGNEVKECMPPLIARADDILYENFRSLYLDCWQRAKNFLTQPPSSPTTPEVVLTMDAITTCESKLSPERKALLDKAKSERRSIRILVTKTVNKLTKDLDASNKNAVTISRAILSKALEDLNKKNGEIWEFYDDEAVALDVSKGEEWDDNGTTALADAEGYLNSLTPTISPLSPAPAPDASASHHAKLPKIDLPKFSGRSHSDYQSFWNSFESLIDKRPDLAKVDKLIYLKRCCIDEVEELAKGYSLTDDNYDNLKKALEKMFGDPRLIQQSHVQNIYDLKPFEVGTIKPFLTSLETSLRCLKEFKVDGENVAPFLVPYVENLMPKEIKQKWREEIHEDKSFSTKKLLDFLHEKMQCYGTVREQKPDTKHKSVPPKTTMMLSMASKEVLCFCCDRSHKIFHCDKFKKMSPKERSNLVFRKKHCHRCLMPKSKDHYPKICKASCKQCQKPHHSFLHWGKPQSGNQDGRGVPPAPPYAPPKPVPADASKPVAGVATAEQTSTNALHHTPLKSTGLTVLKTFKAIPKQKPNVIVRSMIDDGSQTTWILAKTVKALKLPVIRRVPLSVQTAFSDGPQTPKNFDIVKISLRTKAGGYFEMEAAVSKTERMTADMSAIQFDPCTEYPHLVGLDFADDYPRNAAEIELLIGNDYADHIKTGNQRVGNPGEPSAVETLFGWVLSGNLRQTATNFTQINQIATLDNVLEKFFELEEVPNPKSRIKNLIDEQVHEKFKKTITYDDKNQQYMVEIPYTEDVKKLSNNFAPTKALYSKQQELLNKDPEKKATVHKIFEEQLDLGVLELVDDTDPPKGSVHYLPWHLVIRPGHPTTPTRIVKNASFKGKSGISLNSAQHVGPNLLPDIVGSILRFRKKENAFISDIKKMFWQLKIPIKQRDLHRIITHKGVARQTTVMFGEGSSPFLSMAACEHHAKREDIQQKFPKACEYILNELYMDDIPGGFDTTEEGVEILTQIQGFFASMHMRVHKINSNDKELLKRIDGTDDSEEATVLGLKWNTAKDLLEVPNKEWDKVPSTKREYLQKIASFWDPIGVRSPLICKGKIIMQKIWQQGSNWDDLLTEELKREIEEFKKATVITIVIPRFFGIPFILHIFVDASESAYAAVAYVISGKGSFFLLSKTRVKPVKVVTLPRMELLGAVLGSRLLTFIKEEVFKSGIETYLWTDATIALGWIESSSARYKPFVGNRIAEIQRATSTHSAKWMWVPGDQNPADIPSRGIWPLDEKQTKLWTEGPEFLKTGDWPDQPIMEKPELEKRKVAVNVTQVCEPIIDIKRFSSMEKLLRVTMYVIRFGCPLAGRNVSVVQQRKRALAKLISQEQKIYFPVEFESLQKKNASVEPSDAQSGLVQRQPESAIPKNSQLIQFNPILEDGLIKMSGRVNKNLIILPNKSHLTQLLIRDAHISNLHTGPNQTLAYLRQKYWIIKGMSAVKAVTKSCMTCKRINKPMCQQKMADLPEFRKSALPPFSHTGLDYAGPLFTKQRHESGAPAEKRWIALFTCASTRGVHLEIVNDQSTEEFLMAFARFSGRRGKPLHLYSDNASTFTKAAKLLPDITWQFNPPAAPWWGGFWERLVHSVKTPIKKVLGQSLITDKELGTLIIRIEEQINSRPLTPIVDDPDQVPLTPAEMLIGRPLQQPQDPWPEIPPARTAFSARMKYLRSLQESWSKRWINEYLPALQPRPKWHQDVKDITPGSLVLLKKENLKRHLWPLARVKECHAGRDGHIRSVTLQDNKGKDIKRPIQNLVLLEGNED